MKKRTKTWIIAAIMLFFGVSSVGYALPNETVGKPDSKNFTNLVVFVKFSGEDEFINNSYADTSVRAILDNTYNKSVYSVADYFETVSGGKMNMQTLYLFNGGASLTLSHPREYYVKKDENNPYGYNPEDEYLRTYELRTDWANAVSNAVKGGNKPEDMDGNSYDFADLDLNRDGKFDLITIIYKNAEQDISVDWNSPLWDYQFYSDMISVKEGSKTYQSGEYVQLTCNYKTADRLNLYHGEDNLPILATGKIYHETMHALGPKDLYRSDQTSKVYYMSLMGKHFSPVGQFISVKERESLGWLDDSQIKIIEENGRYTLAPAEARDGVVAYKADLPNEKTLYLEYRQFDESGNKYDTKNKNIYSCNDDALIKGVTIKSGLICYLANTGVRFPSNLNTSGNNWNMEVISHGEYKTQSDCAVGGGEELWINNDILVEVTKMTKDELEFEISGISQNKPRIYCDIKDKDLSVTLTNSSVGGIVLAAEFDKDGNLLRITSQPPQDNMVFSMLSSTASVKVMWWNSWEQITPVAKSKTAAK